MGPSTLWPASSAFISEQESQPILEGPLSGWRIAVKDNIDVAGLRTTAGTRYLKDNVARNDAEAVRRLRCAGATIVGKTNMHELGHGITGINPTFGATLHPENPSFSVGGSSGGSALAVALGKARAALGTDTGGSVRIPAAYTGVVGFRPSSGRYPDSGVVKISPTRDTVGILAKNVEDVAALDEVVSGARRPAVLDSPQPSIGVLAESVVALPWALRETFEHGLEEMSAAGISIRMVDGSRNLDRRFSLGITVLNYETIQALEDYLEPLYGAGAIRDLIECSESPDTRKILRTALERPVTESDYRLALKELERDEQRFRDTLDEAGITMIAYPTTASEPPRAIGRERVDASQELRDTVLNSTPATLAGTPAISIPAGRSRETDLPVGLTLEHLKRADHELLSIAAVVEAALGGVRA